MCAEHHIHIHYTLYKYSSSALSKTYCTGMCTCFLSLGLVYTRYTCQVLANRAPNDRVNPKVKNHRRSYRKSKWHVHIYTNMYMYIVCTVWSTWLSLNAISSRTTGESIRLLKIQLTCNSFSALTLEEEGAPVPICTCTTVYIYTYITNDSITLISTIRYVILKRMSIRNVGLVATQLRCPSVHSKEVAGDQQQHTPTDDYGVDNRGRITN